MNDPTHQHSDSDQQLLSLCYQQLLDLTSADGVLHQDADWVDLPTARALEDFALEITKTDQRDPTKAGRRDRRAAVFTAGPAGVGKSHALTDRAQQLSGYRHIDPDAYKDRLLTTLLQAGYLKKLASHILADGRAVSPREISHLVHRQSVIIADDMRRYCLRTGENFIAEGTMQWPGIVDQIEDELAGGARGPAYTELLIVEGRADRQLIHRRAQQRWWHDRNHHQLGGRFVHPAIIDAMLDPTTGSIPDNAEHTFLRLQERGLTVAWEIRSTTPEGTTEITNHTSP